MQGCGHPDAAVTLVDDSHLEEMEDADEVWETSMAPYACCLEKAFKRAQTKGRILAQPHAAPAGKRRVCPVAMSLLGCVPRSTRALT